MIQIEVKAKAKIAQAIAIEEDLTKFENEEKRKGRIFIAGHEYDHLRGELCRIINQINSVANIEGKGRDDLSYDILVAAESVVTKVTPSQSKSIRNAADKIRQSFQKIR